MRRYDCRSRRPVRSTQRRRGCWKSSRTTLTKSLRISPVRARFLRRSILGATLTPTEFGAPNLFPRDSTLMLNPPLRVWMPRSKLNDSTARLLPRTTTAPRLKKAHRPNRTFTCSLTSRVATSCASQPVTRRSFRRVCTRFVATAGETNCLRRRQRRRRPRQR